MTDDSWNDFKKLFIKVHPGFFINLGKSHPYLSATDIRMLALIKLGINNNEMANILGITVEGIKKAKQRLRKKIDIDAIIETRQPGTD
jgi:DNA-binding CsgD family transcriptional regulator